MHYHCVDVSACRLLVPDGIIRSAASATGTNTFMLDIYSS